MKKPPPIENGAPDGSSPSWVSELNNPLAVIVANVEYATERLASGQPSLQACVQDVREPLGEIRAAAERIRDVVRHMVAALPAFPPVAPAPGASREGAERSPSMAPASGPTERRARILIIDDEEALGRTLRRALADYDVVLLVNATDALARISEGERFEFILCDVMMPGLTGVDFYEKLSLTAPDQAERVVFMTGGTTTGRTAAFLSATRNQVLPKPLELQLLRTLIRDRLAGAAGGA